MAYDAFLKIKTPDVAGESTDTTHKGEIELYSFSVGAMNPTTIGSGTTGAGAGKISFQPFSITKKTDKASPVLFQNLASGQPYGQALVTLRKAGGTSQVEYLKYTFTNVYVESIQWSGSTGGDDAPIESASFVFGQIQIDYQPQGDDGKPVGGAIHGGWNIQTNKTA